ncbi:carbohydrate kinase family protein [Lichenihabitans sp. Uapishka_5]|uniref:carbohydrate kinase family protein n=1 Tax=Lichenihabitans sp. Uapishka_5 TaxID=3037302 RepID=UPI0029E7DC5F|nr:carbohydrate kinase family protein [Lichenihabitans sp. Uapishka_5]MDX7951286.1 carbohydrate kinase family protein [Lichenihabitans sp. Uapishka_5]
MTIDDLVLPDGREVPGCIGGDALYAALAARMWEPTTEMVAPVGRDFPPSILAEMSAAGLSDRGLPRRDLPTLHNRVAYCDNGDRTWTLFSSDADFDALSPIPEDIPEAYRAAEAFLVLAMTLPAQERLVAHLKATTRALVALDPQEDYIAGNEAALRRLIAKVDLFMPSAEEVRRLLGHEDWAVAAATFAALGPETVVIKLGAEGCLVHHRGKTFHEPATPAAVRDTTGAGDCFCGAFAASLVSNGFDLTRAARHGTQGASLAITDYGVANMLRTAVAMNRGG